MILASKINEKYSARNVRMSTDFLPNIETDTKYGIYASAQVVLANFTDQIVDEISSGFAKIYGAEWQLALQNQLRESTDLNLRDPQAVMKELARNGASQLRFALNSVLQQDMRKKFYDGIDDLLGERNAWVHRQLTESKEELNDLASSADELLSLIMRQEIYIDWLASLFSKSEKNNLEVIPDVKVVSMEDVFVTPAETPTTIEELQLGQPVTSRFLPFTYLVGVNGQITDKNSGKTLTEISPEYAKLLNVLIQNLRQGSRLRLTEDGLLCSFMDDHWGFLVKVNAAQWFPNHLKYEVE